MIRTATLSDVELLSDIHRESFPNYWNIDAFNDFFSVAGTHALITNDVGMIVYRLHGDDADIMTMAVKPQQRKQGIADALLVQALDHSKSQGAKTMFLDVEEGNAPAIALYEKHGFDHVRRRKQYYRQKDGTFTDALVMQKKL